MRARTRVVSDAGSAARRSGAGARLAVIVTALLTAAGAGCSRNNGLAKAGGLLIDVESDLSVPQDIDHIRIEALQSDGVMLLNEEHDLGSGAWSLPAEILLKPAGKTLPVTVRALAFKNGEVRIERSAVTQIPSGYLGRLHLPLDYLCTDAVTASGDSTCGSGRTCNQGACIAIQIPPPSTGDAGAGNDSITDAGAASLDAGATADAAGCFDVLACFANAAPAVVEEVTCSIALPSNADPDRINIAIELAPGSSGICDQKACWVVIAQGDEGWAIRGARVQLPEEVCLPRPGQPNLTVVMSASCSTNAASTPLCGAPPAATTPIGSPAPPPLLGAACVGFGSQPCGNCGVQTRQCVNGAWQAWSRCNGEGPCAPGVSQACGSMGTRVCADSCQWGACTGQICSGPATQDCGQCGTQSRTCDNGSWSEWSTCPNQGECAPLSMRSCGAGGAQVCGPYCQWLPCIELCAVATGGCDPLTQCTNQGFARACGPCPGGYTGSGETVCVDIDECLDANGGCDPLTTCTNIPGDRICGACPSGYSGSGADGCSPSPAIFLGEIETGGAGPIDVDVARQVVYVASYMTSILRVDVSDPKAMSVTTFYEGYPSGVAVDRATSRVGTVDVYGGHIIVLEADGSLYDQEIIDGCGIAIAAGSGQHRFVTSSQCKDYVSVYDEDSKTVTSLVCFATGNGVVFNPYDNHFYVDDGDGCCGCGGGDYWVLEVLPDNSFTHFHNVGDVTSISIQGANAATGNLYFSSASTSGTIVTDAARNVLATIGVSGPLAISSGLNRFYIADTSTTPTTIRVYDGMTNFEIPSAAFPLPAGFTIDSMLIAPGDNRLYVLAAPADATPVRLLVFGI